MTALLAGVPISSATFREPRYGAALADVALIDDTALVVGSRATLTIGDRSMLGTIRPGGDFGGQAGFSWIAGAGAWSATVLKRPYHDDNGIMLSAVLRDLALDAVTATGATDGASFGAVLEVADRPLGRDWARPTALARDLLGALATAAGLGTDEWWVDDTGITHLGPRPATSLSSTTLTIDPYDPALRHGTARLFDDAISGLVPGATLTAQGLPAPLVIGATTIHVEGGALTVDLWGERTAAELFDALVDASTAWRAYLRRNPYRVLSVGGDGRVAVTPADARSVDFPDAPQLGHAYGLPGASYELQAGANVIVEHLAGDPGSPVVGGHLPGPLPVSLTLDATTAILVGGGAVPLVKDGPLQAWVAALTTALAGHGITVPALTGEATTKMRGE